MEINDIEICPFNMKSCMKEKCALFDCDDEECTICSRASAGIQWDMYKLLEDMKNTLELISDHQLPYYGDEGDD